MTENKKILAVIWDVGGVLVRTEDQEPRQRLAQRLGVTLAELNSFVFDCEPAIRATVGKGTESEIWDNFKTRFHLSADELSRAQNEFWAGDRLDTGLIDFIRKLKPFYRTGILSNAWPETRGTLTAKFNFLDTFDVLIFSGEVGLAKPDPAIFQLALDRLGVQAHQAVFIDDFPDNIAGARSLGINVIRFQKRDQTLTDLQKILGVPQ